MMFVSIMMAMVCLSIPIVPSSAQLPGAGVCWVNFTRCILKNANSTDPEMDPKGLSFNAHKYMCCALTQQMFETDLSCFCTVSTYLHSPQGYNVTLALISICNTFASLDTLDATCAGAHAEEPTSSDITADAPDATETPATKTSSDKLNIAVGLGVILAILVIFGLVIGGICVCCCRQQARKRQSVANNQNGNLATENVNMFPKPYVANYQSSVVALEETQYQSQTPSNVVASASKEDGIVTSESLQYELQTIKKATNNFSDDCKIGQGGFGFVYKGILANGQDIAVKRLSSNSGQGDKEFRAEVELLAKLRHRNLVSLLGFCPAGDEKLLVYEFVANKSLDYFLFDVQKKGQLIWSIRYDIIRGTARGMLYLHEDSPTRIIHRDLKSANVLLDGNLNPKIADFGLARMFDFEQTHLFTSRVTGTQGYMAPEYLMLGQMSVKSDVYSFGVLVLEIVSGKRINAMYQSGAGENLLSNAWKCLDEGRPLDFMDPTIKECYSEDEVMKCIHLGLLSVQEDVNKRPTMAKILHMLDSDSSTGPPSTPNRPTFRASGFSEQSTTRGSNSNASSLLWSGTA